MRLYSLSTKHLCIPKFKTSTGRVHYLVGFNSTPIMKQVRFDFLQCVGVSRTGKWCDPLSNSSTSRYESEDALLTTERPCGRGGGGRLSPGELGGGERTPGVEASRGCFRTACPRGRGVCTTPWALQSSLLERRKWAESQGERGEGTWGPYSWYMGSTKGGGHKCLAT